MTESRTLLLVDDHPLFADGFAAMVRAFRPGWSLITALSSAEGCERLARLPMLDLVIADIKLPDRDGFETLTLMAALAPGVPRVIISGRDDAAAQARAIRAGACGFIVKSAAPDTIVHQLDAAMSGGAFTAEGGDHTLPRLSPRQDEVLTLLASGCSNKEIRARLNIAERTVRAHLTELFHALHVSSRVQAILRARELGLVE